MEEMCRSYAASYGLRVSIARLFSVFGAELKKQLLWDLCTRLAASTRPLVLGGSGNELRDWTDVRDVVRALDLLAAQACVDVAVVNVGTGIGSSVRQIAAAIGKHWPLPDGSDVLQFSGQSRPGDPFTLIANATGLNKLGFAWGIPVDEGLAAYVRWFQGQREALP
jgi:UDP-glucose 4-epimerase